MRDLSWNTLKHRVDLDAVIDDLGIEVVSESGGERIARCPLPSHGGHDRTPHFAINSSKLIYNCFKCGGGTLQYLVEQMEGLSPSSALAWLAQRTRGHEGKDPGSVLHSVQRLLYFSEEPAPAAIPWFPHETIAPFLQTSVYEERSAYYQGRGISWKAVRELKLGYDPTYTKFNPKTRTEYIGEAAIIPHFFEGHLVGYQARWIGDRPEGLPRYDNTKSFPKSDTLYNWDYVTAQICNPRSERWNEPVYVVESPLTVAYLHGLGLMAVATFGSPPSTEQANLLRHLKHLILSADNDVAGEKGTRFLIANLKRSCDIWWVPPVLDIEKGNLLDLAETQGDEAVREHIKLQLPASLYDYYMDGDE